MSQKKNSVVLSSTAYQRLQKLVESGEYCSVDDAASHIITSVLGSTRQYSPVLPVNQTNSAPTPPSEEQQVTKPDSEPKKLSAADRLRNL